MGNTVEMAGGDINTTLTLQKFQELHAAVNNVIKPRNRTSNTFTFLLLCSTLGEKSSEGSKQTNGKSNHIQCLLMLLPCCTTLAFGNNYS